MKHMGRKNGEKTKKPRGRRYKSAPKASKAARAAAAFILVMAFAGAATAILAVDHNCRSVGWNQQVTELSVGVSGHTLQMVFIGGRYSVDIGAIGQAQRAAARIGRMAYAAAPSPVRLVDMLTRMADPAAARVWETARRDAQKVFARLA